MKAHKTSGSGLRKLYSDIAVAARSDAVYQKGYVSSSRKPLISRRARLPFWCSANRCFSNDRPRVCCSGSSRNHPIKAKSFVCRSSWVRRYGVASERILAPGWARRQGNHCIPTTELPHTPIDSSGVLGTTPPSTSTISRFTKTLLTTAFWKAPRPALTQFGILPGVKFSVARPNEARAVGWLYSPMG